MGGSTLSRIGATTPVMRPDSREMTAVSSPPRLGEMVICRLPASEVSSVVAVRPDVVAVCDCTPVPLKLKVVGEGATPVTAAFA